MRSKNVRLSYAYLKRTKIVCVVKMYGIRPRSENVRKSYAILKGRKSYAYLKRTVIVFVQKTHENRTSTSKYENRTRTQNVR